MPHRRVLGATEHRDFKQLLKSLERWHRKDLQPSRNQCTGTISLLGDQKRHPWFDFMIVLSNHEKGVTVVYRGLPNIEILKNFLNL